MNNEVLHIQQAKETSVSLDSGDIAVDGPFVLQRRSNMLHSCCTEQALRVLNTELCHLAVVYCDPGEEIIKLKHE